MRNKNLNGECANCESTYSVQFVEELVSQELPEHCPFCGEVIEELDRAGLLPSITFIFSRAACDDAVSQCLAGGVTVTTPEERLIIRGIVDAHFPDASSEELRILAQSVSSSLS